MKMFNKLKSIFKKKKPSHYPWEFFIVDHSPPAQELGLKNTETKVITVFGVDDFGNLRIRKKYIYSPERVDALEKIHKIPGFDKTIEFPEQKLPIFSTILPMEVDYKK